MYINRPVPAFGFIMYRNRTPDYYFTVQLLLKKTRKKKEDHCSMHLFILTLVLEKKNASLRMSEFRSSVVTTPFLILFPD